MRVTVCGAGPVGGVTALLLAAAGHRVTVLGLDPDGAGSHRGTPRGEAVPVVAPGGSSWPFVLPSRVWQLLAGELPRLAERLTGAGAAAAGAGHLVVRRAVMLSAVERELAEERGITVDRQSGAVALLAGRGRLPGRPHIQGVLTGRGEAVLADLLVDATGRGSPLARWLTDVGAPRPFEEHADSLFRLHTRRFRSSEVSVGESRWDVRHVAGVAVASVSGAGGSWVTVGVRNEDVDLQGLAGLRAWNRIAGLQAALLPQQEESLRPGVRVSVSSGSRYRRLVAGGRPVAGGVVAVGSAAVAVSDLHGFGPGMSVLHAVLLRDAARDPDALEVAERFDQLTLDHVAPVHLGVTGWEEQVGRRTGVAPHGPVVLSMLQRVGPGITRDLLTEFARLTGATAPAHDSPPHTALAETPAPRSRV